MSDPLPAAPRGYTNIRVLGSGGFGVVTLARHEALGRLVAIKFLHANALADPDALSRFRREAVVLASIESQTVVRVHDVRFKDTQPMIIMEYVPGEALDQLLARRDLAVSELLVVLRDVANALEAAHHRGITHRDVKPANVFVLPAGNAKLGDFGLARITADQAIFRTAADTIGGTPAYLPPEVALGTAEPDARSDTYSFAVMAYEMLAGQLPFTDRGIMGLIAAHAREPAPDPRTIVPSFPAAAAEALLAALVKEPQLRPAPSELVALLSAVPQREWPEVVRQEQRGPADRTRRVAPTARVVPSAPRRKKRQRSRRLVVAGVAAVVAGGTAAGIAVAAGSGGGARPTDPLRVSDVSVRASATTGRCPRAEWTFTAAVATNGASGQLRLQWQRPDAKSTPAQIVSIAAGQRSATVVLRFAVTGSRPLRGQAVLALLSPERRSIRSAPISYTC